MNYEVIYPGPQSLPANESREHYILKQAAAALLRTRFRCYVAATEVPGFTGNSGREGPFIIDAAGLRKSADGRELYPGGPRVKVYGIEVKVSRSDFQSGFCTSADVMYLMTTPGLLRPDELPPGFGLIEAVPDDVALVVQSDGWLLGVRGIKIVRKPGRRADTKRANPGTVLLGIAARLQAQATRGQRFADVPTLQPTWARAAAR